MVDLKLLLYSVNHSKVIVWFVNITPCKIAGDAFTTVISEKQLADTWPDNKITKERLVIVIRTQNTKEIA